MAKAKINKTIEVTIIMNEAEAKWLKEIMQNPFWGQTPDNESEINNHNRQMFWDILDSKEISIDGYYNTKKIDEI